MNKLDKMRENGAQVLLKRYEKNFLNETSAQWVTAIFKSICLLSHSLSASLRTYEFESHVELKKLVHYSPLFKNIISHHNFRYLVRFI